MCVCVCVCVCVYIYIYIFLSLPPFLLPSLSISSLSVVPVIQPELLEFPGFSPIQLNEGEDLNLTCTVQTGLNARVWWTAPNKGVVQPGAKGNSSLLPIGSLVHAVSTANITSEYVVQYTSVLYLQNFSSELAGVYTCIADDPGYSDNTAHEEYQVEIRLSQIGL